MVFKFEEMDSLGIDRNLWVYQKFDEGMLEKPRAKSITAWKNSTFELSDLVSAIRCRNTERVNVKYAIQTQENDNITITENK